MCQARSVNNIQFAPHRYLEQSPIAGATSTIVGSIGTSTSVGMISIGYPSTNTPPAVFIKIHSLPNNKLSMPIDIVVEPDEDGFFASAPDIPTLYGCGNTRTEAVEMLTREIESLYEDLIGGDQFTADWEDTKKYLMSRIIK